MQGQNSINSVILSWVHQYANLLFGIAWMWGLTRNSIDDTKHCSSLGLRALLPPPLLGSINPTPLSCTLSQHCTIHFLPSVPTPSLSRPTIPSETFPAKNCITSKPQKWLLGWLTQVPFNHTAKTEATGSHQPTYMYVCTYLHSYIHTRSKTDNVGVWSMSPLSSCAVQHTPHLPT